MAKKASKAASKPKAAAPPPAPQERQWPAATIVLWPLAKLVPSARNARIHSEDQVKQIAASIEEFGWTIPVLVDEAGELIAGHGRIMAAHLLKLDRPVPTMVARGWTDEQKRAYRIADNKLTEGATWDKALLKIELTDLKLSSFDLALTGFAPEALVSFLTDPTAPDQFPAFGEDIVTAYCCPKCGYRWSGKPTPEADGDKVKPA